MGRSSTRAAHKAREKIVDSVDCVVDAQDNSGEGIVDCADPLGPFETAADLARFMAEIEISHGPVDWVTLQWSVIDCAPFCPLPDPECIRDELGDLRASEVWMATFRLQLGKKVLCIVGQVPRGRKTKFPIH